MARSKHTYEVMNQMIMQHHKSLMDENVKDPKRQLIDDISNILGDISIQDRHLLLMSAGITNPSVILNTLSRHLDQMIQQRKFNHDIASNISRELKNLAALFSKKG